VTEATQTIVGRLVERSGEWARNVHVLARGVTSIGRADDNQIVVPNNHASRRHAQIRWDGDHYMLEDLGSKNGTFLNGRRMTEPHPLQHGDLITVPGLTFSFDANDETITVAPGMVGGVGIQVNIGTGEVWAGGQRVQLSAKEFLAISLLYERRGALVTKQELAVHVWPEQQGAVADYSIEKLVSRLRRKLEADPEHPQHLLTMRGVGYRLVVT
jgi:pSer/pThr/pTyr-binding forkhead associated (FHA) protein